MMNSKLELQLSRFNKKHAVMAVGTVLFLCSVSAFAAIDAAVTTAISTALADVIVVGGAVFGVLVAATTFKWLRRAL
jgi:hypothetical protein